MSTLNSRYEKLFRTFDVEVRPPLSKLAQRARLPLVFVYRRGRVIAYENFADAPREQQTSQLVEVNPAAKMMNDREIWFQDHPVYKLEAHVAYSPDFRDKILVDPEMPFFAIPVDATPGIDGFN